MFQRNIMSPSIGLEAYSASNSFLFFAQHVFHTETIRSHILVTIDGVRIGHSQVVTTTADSHTAKHCTLKLLRVLSLDFTIRFLAMDLSQSHRNYSTCTVFSSHAKSPWQSLIPSTADSLNSDLRLYDSPCLAGLGCWLLRLSSDHSTGNMSIA
jgi:hypothetical protein